MKINDFLPLILSKAAPQADFIDAKTVAVNASKEMDDVSALWLLSQKARSPREAYRTPVMLVTEHAPKTFPIYVVRRPGAQAIGCLEGLRVTPEFFKAFPPAVRLGLIWGMGTVITDQRMGSGMPGSANGATTRQTYGQNPGGERCPSNPTYEIAEVFGENLAQETQHAWDKYMSDNNLSYDLADFEDFG